MVGMTIPSGSTSSESDRRVVTIEVTGICNPSLMRTGTCTMTVPYDRFSQTLQGIHRLNGKVASVTMAPISAPVASAAPTAPPARAAELPPDKERSSKPKRKQRR
jgi:CpcD/allophycocyanin linker domain